MTPARYRRRFSEIEAKQFNGSNGLDICRWAKVDYDQDNDPHYTDAPVAESQTGTCLSVLARPSASQDGPQEDYAGLGDWVVRYADGRYAVFTDTEFRLTFEVAP